MTNTPVKRGASSRGKPAPSRSGAVQRRPRAYEGGEIRRTDPDFLPALSGPNLAAERTLSLLRRRCRALCDDHDLIHGARETWINEIGTHYLEPNTGDKDLDQKLAALFWKSAEAIDPGREESLFDIQELALAELFAVGEVLSYFPVVPEWRGFKPSVGIDLIDTDLLPLDTGSVMYGLRPAAEAERVRQGVVFDQLGRRIAYEMYAEHPADGCWSGYTAGETRRLNALDANLMVLRRRPKQIRGVPWPVAVVRTTRMEDAYNEAGILLAQAAAYIGVVYKGVRPPDFTDQISYPVDGRGNPVTELEPGGQTFIGDNPHADAKIIGGNTPGPSYKTTLEVLQCRMAAGLNQSYTSLARDSSKATFAAQRADSLADRKGWRRKQKFLARNVTMPWWRRRVRFAVLTGDLQLTPQQLDMYRADPDALCEASIVFEGWEWVNPAQEAAADEASIRMGIASTKELAARRGRHVDDLIAEEVDYQVKRRAAWRAAGLGEPPPLSPPSNAAPVPPGDGTEPDEQPAPSEDSTENENTSKPRPPRGRLSANGHRELVHA
ncbi:MAG: phage portal protein [Phycisphaerales bacterium]|nr:phage portal protein [Phycisphaerales bacterium]